DAVLNSASRGRTSQDQRGCQRGGPGASSAPGPARNGHSRGRDGSSQGCQQYGHLAEGCQDYFCRNCLGPGHQAKDCKNPRRCKACGGEGHLARSCPGQVRSYATVLAGGGSAALKPSNPGGEGLVSEKVRPSRLRLLLPRTNSLGFGQT
uniref:CCHC-type domain-containing protein n=1 Tax=Electrophorus electricus TaxID=8005 RepID=A0A4W4E0U5_ELEEL